MKYATAQIAFVLILAFCLTFGIIPANASNGLIGGNANETISLLLLLPLVATIVSVMHYMVGVSGYGIFMPTMMAVVMMSTGIVNGLILFGLDMDDEMLKRVMSEIIHLNPKPGSAWSGNILEKSMSTIVPDFILENDENQLTVHLNNSNVPELRVNTTYNEMFQDYAGNKQNQSREMKDAVMFVKQKIDSARWFIDAIKQRQQTLLTTMMAIVKFQKQFFIEGDDTYLKPMILKDIADITGYDISTISRVSNSKYIQTEFGIFPVKYFFSESMTNDSGEEVSTREIKQILLQCIENEDKRKPINDDALAAVLKTKGYIIARRTVAKYREQLNIPVARMRKEI